MKRSNQATLVAVSLLVIAALLVAGCVTNGETPEETTLTVFTAASLTGAFTDIGKAYEAENENVKVDFVFDGSQTLRTQIEQGANPDIFVSASIKHMKALQDAGFMDNDTVTPFLGNSLALVVPIDNPAGITDLADLAKPGVKIVIGTKDVPFGDYTRQMLDKMAADPKYGEAYKNAFMANVISEETAVSNVMPKLILGEADAAIVYKSDVSKEDRDELIRIDIPPEYNVMATYPLGILAASPHKAEAESFIAFVRGPVGSAILTDYGFDPLPAGD
ncbi:MAG TPA: molybdate ABC transporter substrate-binding protein [Candidatus Methanoculleus thermohydrogenotrophicum]|jgi:molybdate transport system substrate-binding protein|nr:molybdate ABC transporter substrate-binding protein [Candidatus Methanoculleus thermohydrogenotrophicum]NLM82682.1 molybdate ABC transporter substrate-binding protein [Candidatus Methanoculleus thermohydrogenotrophicum]HOB17706.1 molybdate ABC transporter substrate-binding protein [Candidatus Methanoculleus thermohydrogenotrophicum]HPZ37937.1 molybdate ABC transporter substrate-binding protein [Candidatus Methanoculleus thermohydrogenotrophicum]HQC91120.1 molybdate ABC transporter substrate-